jgi:hypothetical protein
MANHGRAGGMKMTEPLAVSVPEAKRHLGDLSTATVYRMFKRGELQKLKVGGRTLISMESIKALLARAE